MLTPECHIITRVSVSLAQKQLVEMSLKELLFTVSIFHSLCFYLSQVVESELLLLPEYFLHKCVCVYFYLSTKVCTVLLLPPTLPHSLFAHHIFIFCSSTLPFHSPCLHTSLPYFLSAHYPSLLPSSSLPFHTLPICTLPFHMY